MKTLVPALGQANHPPAVESPVMPVVDDPVSLLLVDDDPRNLDVLASILDSPNYRLVRAQTPEDALLALISSDFAVIVLDIRMPGMNGLELAQIIKERKKTQHIPIIFLTAYYHENDHVMHGYDAGAVDYLTKPCNPVVLRSKVSVFVHLFRKTRALQAEINERKRLETEIARAIEREQLRLGQELHDGLSQQLTGIGFMIKAMETKLQKVSPALARESARLELLIRQTIDQSRDLAKGFYPVELERLGLVAALQEIPRHIKQLSTIEYVVESDGNPACACLKGPHAVQLFRIAQEATHNAVKHARAKRIVVRLTMIDDNITLTVKDDGIGFSQTPEAKTGMGWMIMRYRARMVGGTLDIRNGDDGGVMVTCSVPNVAATAGYTS
ncbi:MAG TPA: response regulator [Verrucomicrobiae bacterium]|nr:response regulator [Verrucomicrobiae bacterium]